MKTIFPDYEFEDVTKIDENLFKNKDLIILDIDNTLVYPETTKIREDIQKWFQKINKKYKCVCFSNSLTIKKRKNEIKSQLNCDFYISRNKKPSKKLFKKIILRYNARPEKTLVIGDFRFTDVLFGNLNNATTILVKPFSHLESKKIRILRKIENFIAQLF